MSDSPLDGEESSLVLSDADIYRIAEQLKKEETDSVPAWVRKAIIFALVGFAALGIVQWVFYRLQSFLIVMLVTLFLSFAMEPAVNSLAKRGWRRGLATAVVMIGGLVVALLFVGLMVNLVVQEVQGLADNMPEYIDQTTNWVNDKFNTEFTTDDLNKTITEYQDDLQKIATDVGGRVINLTSTAIGILFQMLTIGLFTFYLVAEGPRFRRTLCSVLKPDRQRMVLNIWELSIAKTGGYLYSRLILAGLSTVCSWIVFSFIGVPSPLALALWLGFVSQFVPVIGTYFAGLLPIILALLDRPLSAVWVLLFILAYQQIENYYISPRVTSRTLDIHPAFAFGSVIVGSSLMGPVGALLALPAAAIGQAFVSSTIERQEVVESELLASPLRTEKPSARHKRPE